MIQLTSHFWKTSKENHPVVALFNFEIHYIANFELLKNSFFATFLIITLPCVSLNQKTSLVTANGYKQPQLLTTGGLDWIY